jgi:hypothetical protein
MRNRWITLDGGRAIAFGHETDDQARARYARIEEHRNSLIEYADPRVEAAYKAGVAARKRTDEDNTVTVSSGKHIIPDDMANELVERLHPRYLPVGTYGARMRVRQAMRIKCAGMLGISLVEVADVVAQLKANRHRRYIGRARRAQATA